MAKFGFQTILNVCFIFFFFFFFFPPPSFIFLIITMASMSSRPSFDSKFSETYFCLIHYFLPWPLEVISLTALQK